MLQKVKNIFWHPAITFAMAMLHGLPARHMVVIGVTGTKGKSTTCDMLYAVLTSAGYKTALASTIRFAYPGYDAANKFKMTMQGRGHIHAFLARARKAGATHAIVEITSEGTRQARHKYLALNGLIVTNIQREHIESHGSMEKYVAAKRAIVAELEKSPKKNRILVVNGDNEYTKKFLDARVEVKKTFTEGALGDFNATNARAAVMMAEELGVSHVVAEKAIADMPQVRGRVEPIRAGQRFAVIVDYAHTPDSLKALYAMFPGPKICVLGNTGGGRDTWKRPEMGAIADQECHIVILTNEDPYDEDPRAIIDAMAAGMKRTPDIVMDRREAIASALRQAQAAGDQHITVLISGKGTDPYIMGPQGLKTRWDDATVVREELAKFGFNRANR